jgi:WD40 repeat protein
MRVLQSEPRRPLDLLAVAGGGRVAAACSTIGVPGHVEVWEVMTGEVRHRPLVSQREARSLALTPDGRFLLVAETLKTAVFDLDGTDTTLAVPGPERHLAYPEFALSADGTRLVVAEARDNNTALSVFEVGEPPTMFPRLWTTNPGRMAWYKHPAISADGSRIAVVRSGDVPGGEEIEIRDRTIDSEGVRARIAGSALTPVRQLAFSPDGATLFTRVMGTVRVYNAAGGAVVGGLTHPGRAGFTGLAVRANDGVIATCRDDGTVWLWHPTTLQPITTLDWKLGPLVSVAFAPDGSIGAAGTAGGQVVVWDADV